MKLKERLLSVLFPPKCIFCRKTMAKEGVCADCAKRLPRRKNPKVKEGIGFVDACFAPLYYEGYVRSAILRYKFGGVKASAVEFAKILAPCIEENLDGKYDSITWVPTSRGRRRKRGYDQAQVLAEELGRMLGVPCQKLLKKNRDAKPQSRQSTREKRMANIIGAFDMKSQSVLGKRILLIDDIATTGSTISECARVLKTAGAAKVYAAVLAKTRLSQKNN